MKNLFYLIAFIPSLLFAQIIQDPCTLTPDPGPCFAAVPKFYFNQETQQCQMFTWGGCAGIVPFNTLSECEAATCASETVDTCEAVLIEGCFSIDIWVPVCGCDGETYSNAGYAACNSIFDFTMGECGTTVDIEGCTDSTAFNYNPFATLDDGSCWFIDIPGCTDSTAINYNPIATFDDGSCVYTQYILGCIDPIACNYNVEAIITDFSCTYSEEYYDCDGVCEDDLDGDQICDVFDNCMSISYYVQLDSDGDNEGDACDYDDNLDVDELKSSINPLIRMIDILGREYEYHPNGKILFYIYQDNTVEKKVHF